MSDRTPVPAHLTVRPCEQDDVDLIAELEPPGRNYARATFAAQESGVCLYLVAWIGERPVGAGELAWGETPELKNLQVDADLRGRGVGTSLIARAEAAVQSRGAKVLAIGVAEDNPGARSLYIRLGYSPTGRTETCTYEYVDDHGRRRKATETSEYLVKELPDPVH